MITLKEFLEATQYKITGGSEYQWRCFGPNARYIDCDGAIDQYSTNAIYDSVTQTVYAAELWDYVNDRAYRWINPGFLKAIKKECKKRDIAFENASDAMDYTDLEVADDIMEKIRAVVAGEEYDVRIQVPIDLPDEMVFELMKMAHERDITLNQMVEEVLKQVIKRAESGELNEEDLL